MFENVWTNLIKKMVWNLELAETLNSTSCIVLTIEEEQNCSSYEASDILIDGYRIRLWKAKKISMKLSY